MNAAAEALVKGAVSVRRRWRVVGAIVFWSWNLLFLALIAFGFIPIVLASAVADAARGRLPWDLLATGLLLTALPVAAVVFAARNLKWKIDRLPALFYGLEAPLGLLCVARIFLMRELNPGMVHALASFFLGASFFAMEMVGGVARRRWARQAQLAGATVGLLVAAYAGALCAFYAVPAAAHLAKELLRFAWITDFAHLLLHATGTVFVIAFVGVPLFLLTALLFIGTPLALPLLYARSFARVARAHRPALGGAAAAWPCVAAVAASVALFVAANRQPQPAAFAALQAPPADAAARARLLDRQDEIRAGLVNAYLATYRYLGKAGDAHDLESLYQSELHLPAPVAADVQRAFVKLAAPFFYDGVRYGDGDPEKLYAAFFDAPLQKRENEAVLRALTTTYSQADREAGFLDRGQRRVRLVEQEVRVAEHGAVAEVEIHDRWENQTYQDQEVVLTFSLPEEAAITGLWLGASDDRDKRWPAVVSPRGAAQAVYRREVQRRYDPALLEQVGPRQYRLRAFPVPGRSRVMQAPATLHVWLTYATPPSAGEWPLPRLIERRNAYWDGDRDGWVPGHLSAGHAGGDVAVALPGGETLRRIARGDGARWAARRRLAVVVDRSFSMAAHAQALRAELDAVARLAQHNQVDVFLTSASSRGEPPRRLAGAEILAAADLVPFGGSSLREMLDQADALAGPDAYDAMLVLTDDGGADLAVDHPSSLAHAGAPPLWLVHVGGAFPASYDDDVLARLDQSHGGVAASVTEALDRAAALSIPNVVTAGPESMWILEPPGASPPARPTQAPPPRTPLDAVAAHQMILARSRAVAARNGDDTRAALDQLHALAVTHGIVSPYSSMIVLVDDRQRQALAAAEKADDRFDRQVDPQAQSLTHPSSPFDLAATPEPHEWILIGLGGAALAVTAARRRRWRPRWMVWPS